MKNIKLRLFIIASSSIFFSFGAKAQLSFEPIRYYSTAKFGSGNIAIGDFNNDGKPDIATTLHEEHKVALLMNTGNATFDAPVLYSVDISDPSLQTPWGIALGDVNGDSFLDIVTTNATYHPPHSKMGVLINNGDGTFATPVFYETDFYPTAVMLKDLNGDHKLDAVVANATDTTISVLMNNGDGTFAPQATYVTGPNPIAIASGDFDGDGSLDLAFTTPQGVKLFKNNGTGIFSQGPVLPSFSSDFAGDILATDLNGDSKPDLLVATNGVDKKFYVFMNNGNGNFNAPIVYHKEATKMVAIDMNNDGKTDLVIADANAPDFNSIYLNDGTGTFGTPIKVPCVKYSGDLAVADLNGDGKPDLINGTSFADSCSIVLQAIPAGTGVNTVNIAQLSIKLFPNPGKNHVTVVSPVNNVLHIYDATSRLLKTCKIKEGTNDIDIRSLNSGTYLFEVGGQAVKFEKQK